MQLDGLGAPLRRPRGPRLAVESLAIYERHGGHTLGRHVGLSAGETVQRIRDGAAAAGYFADGVIAQRAVESAIHRHRDRIAEWLWGPRGNARYSFVEDLKHVVGTMLTRQEVAHGVTDPTPATAVRLVLQPSDQLVAGFTVVTAYPTRSRHRIHRPAAEPRRAEEGVPA